MNIKEGCGIQSAGTKKYDPESSHQVECALNSIVMSFLYVKNLKFIGYTLF